MATLDLGTDRMYGHVKANENRTTFLAFIHEEGQYGTPLFAVLRQTRAHPELGGTGPAGQGAPPLPDTPRSDLGRPGLAGLRPANVRRRFSPPDSREHGRP